MLHNRYTIPLVIHPFKLLNDTIIEDLEKTLHPECCPSLKVFEDKNASINNEGISLKLDVSQYQPNELSINVVDGGILVVEGKHQEKEDGQGHIKRHFVRKIYLPENLKPEDIKSELTKEGILSIEGKCVDGEDTQTVNIPINVK